MEIIAAVLIFIILTLALLIIGAVWLACVFFLIAMAVLFVGGLVGLIVFAIAVIVGSLIWETYKHSREKRRLMFEEIDRLEGELRGAPDHELTRD